MNNNSCKPMLSIEQQIQHLKNKGVSFSIVSENDAKDYLKNNNYYFKLTSYRKNYEKHPDGPNAGQYIELDFGYLKDLAIIDMKLRYLMAQMSFDIEHYAKIECLRVAEDHYEDGYSIVEEFKNSLSQDQLNKLNDEIKRNFNSDYCGELFQKYQNQIPLWVFLELIPFGRLVSFYGFFAKKYADRAMLSRFYQLKMCKNIRNAAAHSSCIINDLRPKTSRHKKDYVLMKALSQITTINSYNRKKKMSNARVQQIVTLLYVYNIIVTSEGVKKKAIVQLHELENRMFKNIDYYQNNDIIRTTFEFLQQVIDNWYTNE